MLGLFGLKHKQIPLAMMSRFFGVLFFIQCTGAHPEQPEGPLQRYAL